MALYLFKSTYRIKPNLYLGDAKLARSKFFLETNSIIGIINVTTNEPNAYPDLYDYLRVNINDESNEEISAYFQDVFDFIRRHHQLGHNVLVHCQMGISRSATCVIAFLMIDESMTLGDAFQQVKHVRPQIDPNEGFLRQLRELEKTLFGQTMTLHRITSLDLSIDEPSNIVMNRALIALNEYVTGFTGDASPQTLDIVREKLLCYADKIKHEDIPNFVSNGIQKYLRVFDEHDESQNQEATVGLQQALLALFHRRNINIDDCLTQVVNRKSWQDLCMNFPLANQWINNLQNQLHASFDQKK